MQVSLGVWSLFYFILSFFIFYKLSMINYDYHLRFHLFTRFPKQMKLYENYRKRLNFRYQRLMSRLPFGGDIPEVDRPETYNKAKAELKEYIFGTKQKAEEDSEYQIKLQAEGKGINFMI